MHAFLLWSVCSVLSVNALRRTEVGSKSLSSASSLLRSYPFYHSSDQISTLIENMDCAVPLAVHSESNIDVVDIGNPANLEKAFYLFGEHARELISPETALRLIEKLCSRTPSRMVVEALKTTHFRIIPNGNPVSRSLVEQQGQTCLRLNERGVDLNRNWDSHWKKNGDGNLDQVNPGAYAFSESETQLFRKAVVEFQPTVFATIHSGTRGMYMPWAFNAESGVVVRNEKKMKSVLAELDAKFCQCPYGQAAAQVGYDSPGTCLDWVHEHTKTQFSYAFEIYTGIGEADLVRRYQEQLRGASFLQESCFEQFNPETQETYDDVVNNWADALIQLAIMGTNGN